MNLLALLPYSQFLACTFVLGTFQTSVLHPRKTWWVRGGEEFQSWSFCLWELGCQQTFVSFRGTLPSHPTPICRDYLSPQIFPGLKMSRVVLNSSSHLKSGSVHS